MCKGVKGCCYIASPVSIHGLVCNDEIGADFMDNTLFSAHTLIGKRHYQYHR